MATANKFLLSWRRLSRMAYTSRPDRYPGACSSVQVRVLNRSKFSNPISGRVGFSSTLLLLTVRKQSGCDSSCKKTMTKNTCKLAVNWKRNNGVHEIHWSSRSADLGSMENIMQLLKMNLRRKKIESYRSLVSAIKRK